MITGGLNKGITIIVTAYKASKTIRATLDSIEYQTQFIDNDDFEVLVGIDNCEDTKKYLESIRGNYRNLRLFWFPENHGTYIVKTNLAYKSKYSYLVFFDSDDIMYPTLISEVYTNRVNGDIVRLFTNEFSTDGTPTKKDDLAGGIFGVRRELFVKFGGFQPWYCSADTELIYRVYQFGYKVYRIEKKLMHRRISKVSLTRRKDVGHGSSIRQGYRDERERLEKLGAGGRDLRIEIKRVDYKEL